MSEQHDTGSEFERRVRSLLVDSSEALDGRTRSHLTQARYAAVAQRPMNTSSYKAWRGWAPAGAVATAVLVTVLYLSQGGVNVPLAVPAGASALDDLELLADADALALGTDADQELDYEFYEWAAAAGEDAGAGLGS